MLTACDKVAGKVEIVSCVTGEVPNGLRNEKAPKSNANHFVTLRRTAQPGASTLCYGSAFLCYKNDWRCKDTIKLYI